MVANASEKTPLKSFMIEDDTSQQQHPFNCLESLKNTTQHLKQNEDVILLELKQLFSLAGSLFFVIALRQLYSLISVAMNGHLDKMHLDAVALANSLISLTCTGITSGGFAVAISTIFGHMYGQQSLRPQIGTVAQRAMVIYLIFVTVITSIYINIEPIFLLIGQNPIVSKLSSYYLTVWLPSAVFEILIMLLNRYLLVQNYKLPCIVISLVGFSLNIIGQYILLHFYQLNYLFSAACHTTSYFVMVLLYLAYIRISKMYTATWEGFRPIDCLQQWRQIIKYSLFIGLTNILHYSMFEVSLLCAGILGINELSEYGVLYSLYIVIAVLDNCLGNALIIRSSIHLGSKDLKSFRVLLKVTFFAYCSLILLIVIVIMSLRQVLPKLFTNTPEIIDIASNHMIYLVIMYVCVTFSNYFLSVILATGNVVMLNIASAVSNLLIGLPLGVILAFLTKLSVVGLLLGCSMGFFLQGVVVCVILIRLKWGNNTQLNRSIGEEREDETMIVSNNNQSVRCFDFIKSKKMFIKFIVIALTLLFLMISILLRCTVYRNICIPYADVLINNMTRSVLDMLTICDN